MMLRSSLLALSLLACSAPRVRPDPDAWDVAADRPPGFDRAAAQAACRAHLEELVALDTRNPPGNELVAARWFAETLAGVPGLETEVIEAEPGRANFVARLRAEHPTRPPVVVMGHMDVVGVQPEKWGTDPMKVTEVDGYLYGRGVIDDKGMLAALVTILPLLAERRSALTRDVILLATAAEEGGPEVGIQWILEHRRDVLGGAEFALNEGGRIRVDGDRVASVNVQTTEKVPYDVAVVARGPSGHGSVPLPDNALAALARAVSRLHEWRAPVRLNETTRLYFAKLAAIEPDAELAAAMRAVSGDDAVAREHAAEVLSRVPAHNALLRTGQSLTMMSGGFRNNVIPSEGTANFNVRVLPGDDVTTIVAAMQAACGEAAVEVSLSGAPKAAPPPSPVDTDLYRALETAAHAMAPGALTLPMMSTGATDGAALRAIGIPTYGILPLPLEVEDELRMHGDNERAPVKALGWASEFLYRTLLAVCE